MNGTALASNDHLGRRFLPGRELLFVPASSLVIVFVVSFPTNEFYERIDNTAVTRRSEKWRPYRKASRR
jgi:hypothetical protein